MAGIIMGIICVISLGMLNLEGRTTASKRKIIRCYIAVAAVVLIVIIALTVRYYWINTDDYKLEEAYNTLKKGEYLECDKRIELDTMAKYGNKDAEALYWLDIFLEDNSKVLDSIYSETVVENVNYRDIFEIVDHYFNWEYSGKYQDFFYEVKSHVIALKQKNPENIRFYSEEKHYAGELPGAGMKTIYFDVCSLGVPSKSKIEMDIIGGGRHMAYDWVVDGKQIFHADAKYGYVYSVCDYRYKLDQKNNTHQNNSPGGLSGSFGGWAVPSDPYDVHNYYDAEDFADEWGDDFDDWDEAFDYWEEHH